MAPARGLLLAGLGEAARELGDELAVSHERLGLDSGVHRNFTGGIEGGQRPPTLATVAQLAATLGIGPSELTPPTPSAGYSNEGRSCAGSSMSSCITASMSSSAVSWPTVWK